MRLTIKFALALTLCFGFADAFAKNVNVSVGGYTTSGGDYYGGSTNSPVLMFNPANITIDAGDTVTFTNVGGIQVAHNVHADDNSFRCANGCDGAGGNGTPAFNTWSSTVTFTKAGVVKYHCDEHGNMGMDGTITVNSVAAAGQNVVPGISGNWYNPSPNQGGHGFQIEITPNNGILAIWFVFNPAGTAQNWLYSQGGYTPPTSDVVLPVFLEQGQGLAFPPNYNPSNLTATPWGALEFKFTDCNNGTAEYTPNQAAGDAGYGHVSFPITRLSSIAGLSCP